MLIVFENIVLKKNICDSGAWLAQLVESGTLDPGYEFEH